MRYIEANLFSDVSLPAIARDAFASPSTLLRHFRDDTGKTPHAYIKTRRLEEARRLIEVGVQNSSAFARPFALPPGTPKDRVAALRKAFDATLKDPAFLAEAEKANLSLDPVTGDEMSRLVADVFTLDADTIANTTRAVLAMAAKHRITSLALPALGTGVGHVPPAISAEAMLKEVVAHLKSGRSSLRRVAFVLYQDDAYKTFTDTLKRLGGMQ